MILLPRLKIALNYIPVCQLPTANTGIQEQRTGVPYVIDQKRQLVK